MDISAFCKQHGACGDGRRWAVNSCRDMREVWATAPSSWLLWVATRTGVLEDRVLRHFMVYCAGQVADVDSALATVAVAERYAYGEAGVDELESAWKTAKKAADDAYSVWKADFKDSSHRAYNMLSAAAYSVWLPGALDMAWGACEGAYHARGTTIKPAAAADKQAAWLREHTIPKF